jgi:hypothetical protein
LLLLSSVAHLLVLLTIQGLVAGKKKKWSWRRRMMLFLRISVQVSR